MGIDDESSHPGLCSEVAGGVTRNIVCLFREPDAGNLPVRFDEREQETGSSQTGLRRSCESIPTATERLKATAPVLDSALRSLSTSAPARRLEVEVSVSRRGTCDREIWTKPLVRRTRGSYGFCLGVSNFALPLRGLSDAVNDLGRSLSNRWKAMGRRIFRVISAEFRRTGVSKDTTGERAKARVVGSGVDGRLRRIKGWAP